MEENQKRMVELVIKHANEFGNGVDGDPLSNPAELEAFLKLTLMGDLLFDSLDTVELTMLFEDEFEIELPDNLFENLSAEEYTVGKFIEVVQEQLNKIRVGQL